MFPGDCMHQPALNLPDLVLGLWCGSIACASSGNKATWYWAVLQGHTWKVHEQDVANCTPYLPGSFNRPPCNSAQKILSGYKVWEFLMYIFGLGPGLLYGILPDNIWKNYCKLISGICLLLQRNITTEQSHQQNRFLFIANHKTVGISIVGIADP